MSFLIESVEKQNNFSKKMRSITIRKTGKDGYYSSTLHFNN